MTFLLWWSHRAGRRVELDCSFTEISRFELAQASTATQVAATFEEDHVFLALARNNRERRVRIVEPTVFRTPGSELNVSYAAQAAFVEPTVFSAAPQLLGEFDPRDPPGRVTGSVRDETSEVDVP